ncbi:MAG: hypothetical protein WCF81_03050 [Roseiarcus sp.]
MGPAAAGVGLSATGLSAFGALSGASTAAQGDMLEAQNATNAAQIGQTKAAETEADMKRRLTSQLANISGDPGRRWSQPHEPDRRGDHRQRPGRRRSVTHAGRREHSEPVADG